MEITQDQIEQLYRFYHELDKAKAEASEAIKLAQHNEHNRVTITRENGEQQEVTEKMLWDEVWNLSADSEAGRLLRTKYPYAFEQSDEANKIAANLRAFTLAELSIDAQALRLSDIIKLTQALIRLELSNHGKTEAEKSSEAPEERSSAAA